MVLFRPRTPAPGRRDLHERRGDTGRGQLRDDLEFRRGADRVPANRALAVKAAAIAGGFLPEGQGQHAGKTVVTGNPVRPAVLQAAATPYTPAREGEPFRLLVFGGSQGAQFFSDAVPAAVAALPQAQRTHLLVTQQARADDVGRVKAAYAELGMVPEVLPFFTDMAQRMAAAQLIVSRSGASTVSEIAVIGRPAILVPYPYALDHDQAANAAALAATGGAELHPQSTLTTERLAGLIGEASSGPDRLAVMAAAARSAGKPDAARLLADLAEAIGSGRTVEDFRKGARP
jgi:UDP-N-acetylglucosamine--N-acetylmuramyl-(pentapeptide) pyrophosphoryl-undecaprenol N-acetylglucosamine transferase